MILDALCAEANKIFKADCFDKSRLRNNVDCRIAISVILRQRRYYTYKKIGDVFGVKHDHILFYEKKHKILMQYTHDYRNKYLSLLALFEPHIVAKESYCRQVKFTIIRHA
ncbi:MAG: hypothetical protein C0512_11990 [Flavobacterium sp.]|nr:hypothetical protein [Flavobacterium sp.]